MVEEYERDVFTAFNFVCSEEATFSGTDIVKYLQKCWKIYSSDRYARISESEEFEHTSIGESLGMSPEEEAYTTAEADIQILEEEVDLDELQEKRLHFLREKTDEYESVKDT